MNRLALVTPADISSKESVAAAVLAEEYGFESAWISEANLRDAVSILGAISQGTKKIKLGTAILNVFSRSPYLTAMSVLTLDELSTGRVILGLGSSTPALVQLHGMNFERPFTRIREYIEVVKALTSGQSASLNGKIFTFKDVKLKSFAFQKRIPIYLAALNSQMIELAGEVADGVILNLASPDYIRKALDCLEKGAEKAGKNPDQIDLGCFLACSISKDREAAYNIVRKTIAYYASAQFYDRMLIGNGFPQEVARIKEAWRLGKRDEALSAVSERMLKNLTLAGTLDDVKAQLEEFRSAGLKLPIIRPFPPEGGWLAEVEACFKSITG